MAPVFENTPRIMRVIVVALAAMLILVAPSVGGMPMLMMVCAILAGAGIFGFLLQRPISFVVVMLFWQMFAFFNSNTYFPYVYSKLYSLVRYADEFMIIPLIFVLMVYLVLGRPVKGRPVMTASIVLIFVMVLSGVFHGSGVISIIKYGIAYYRYLIVFVATVTFFHASPQNFHRITTTVWWILIIQFVMNIAYLFGIPILPNRFLVQADDWAVGSMGLSSTMSYFALICLSLGLAGLGGNVKVKGQLNWLYMSVMAVVMVAIANTKHAIGLAIPQLGIVISLSSARRPMRKLLLILITVGLLAGIAEKYNSNYRAKRLSLYDSRLISMASSSKVRIYQNVAGTLTKHNAWILGMGPGNYSSVVALWNTTPLFMKHFYAEVYANRYNPRSSIMLYPRSGVLSLLGDTGLMGLFCYLAVLIVIGIRVFRQLKEGAYDSSPEARILAVGWLGWCVFFVLLNCITDYLNFGFTPLLTFAWGGAVWNPVEVDVDLGAKSTQPLEAE